MNEFSIYLSSNIFEACDFQPSIFILNKAFLLINETKELFLTASSSLLDYSNSSFDTNILIKEFDYLMTVFLITSCSFDHPLSNQFLGLIAASSE